MRLSSRLRSVATWCRSGWTAREASWKRPSSSSRSTTRRRGMPRTENRFAVCGNGCGPSQRRQTRCIAARAAHGSHSWSLGSRAVMREWSDDARRAAAAGSLDVRILQVEPRRHQLFRVVEDGSVQVEEALPIDDQLRALVLEDLVTV